MFAPLVFDCPRPMRPVPSDSATHQKAGTGRSLQEKRHSFEKTDGTSTRRKHIHEVVIQNWLKIGLPNHGEG